jgi:hypothetical protein
MYRLYSVPAVRRGHLLQLAPLADQACWHSRDELAMMDSMYSCEGSCMGNVPQAAAAACSKEPSDLVT